MSCETDNISMITSIDDSDNDNATHRKPHFLFTFFLMCVVACGAISLKNKILVSYKVVVFLFGALFGYFNLKIAQFNEFLNIRFLASIDVGVMYTVVVPCLVMFRAYTIDLQAVRSTSWIALLCLLGGYGLWMTLQSVFFEFYLFLFHSPEERATASAMTFIYFGALMSVSDFRMAVRTFRKSGKFAPLVNLMEVESFMSAVCSVSMFSIINVLNSNTSFKESIHTIWFIIGLVVLSPLLGFYMAKIAIAWLKHLYSNVVLEVTVGLAFAFLTYYISHVFLQAVPTISFISIMVYGVFLNQEHDNFSRGIDTFFRQFLEILQLVSTVLIYTQAGYIIVLYSCRIPPPFSAVFYYIFSLYGFSVISRAVSAVVMLLPVVWLDVNRKSWNEAAAFVVCDHSNPIALLYVVVYLTGYRVNLIDLELNCEYAIFLSIVCTNIIKTVIHGSMLKPILVLLGMKKLSLARHVSLAHAVHRISNSIDQSIKTFKSDRFLADADWDVVYGLVNFDDEYGMRSTRHTRMLDSAMIPEQDIDIEDEKKQQILHAKKISFLKQYEQGMLSLEATRVLLNNIEMELKKSTIEEILKTESVEDFWNVTLLRKIFHPRLAVMRYMKHRAKDMQTIYESLEDLRVLKLYFRFCMHDWTDVVCDLLMILSSVSMVLVLIYQYNCGLSWDYRSMCILVREVNIGIVSITSLITVSQVLFVGVFYSHSLWLYLWLCELILSWIDITLHEVYHAKLAAECFNPYVILSHGILCCRVLEFLRLVRWFHALDRLARIYVNFANGLIQRKLRLGYDIGKGFVNCQDDVMNAIPDQADTPYAEKIKKILYDKKATTMKELGVLQKTNPGIIISVKTQHAGRRILTAVEDNANLMRREGFLDEGEVDMIKKIIDHHVKNLLSIPPVLNRLRSLEMLKQLYYVENDELAEFLTYNMEIRTFVEGEVVPSLPDGYHGIYVLLSGLLKIMIIPYETLRSALQLFTDTRFEELMWVKAALRGAYMLLRTYPGFNKMSYENFLESVDHGIFYKEKLPVPYGKNAHTTESLNLEQYEDWYILLLDGIGWTEDNRVFTAHEVIPSTYSVINFSSLDCESYCVYCVRPLPAVSPTVTGPSGLQLMTDDFSSFAFRSQSNPLFQSSTGFGLSYGQASLTPGSHSMRKPELASRAPLTGQPNHAAAPSSNTQRYSLSVFNSNPAHRRHRHGSNDNVMEVHDHVIKVDVPPSVFPGASAVNRKKFPTSHV